MGAHLRTAVYCSATLGESLVTILAFIVAILVLVSLHELGHFVVARLCGVKVLRFSVGFGKPFFTKKKGDTEWCLAPIPLGGYVKMVDTREGNVADADLPYAFDKQTPLKKIAIVAAGPLTNLVLAVFLYAGSFSFGMTELKPWIGTVLPNTLAERSGFVAGDEIQSVNKIAVKDWTQAQTEIMLSMDSGNVNVVVNNPQGHQVDRVIDVSNEAASLKKAAQGAGIGIIPFKLSLTLGEVLPDGAAAQAGLKAGDTLVSVNGEPLQNWHQWVELVETNAGNALQVVYVRAGKEQKTSMRPESFDVNGRLIGKAGVGPSADQAWDKSIRMEYQPSIGEAFVLGAKRTWDYSYLTVKFFGKLLIGEASINHISGPLTIADIAGKSAAMGLKSYIEFLALISISLGVLNLLPIPVLDGGHLLYYAIELVRGKPLSERLQAMGMRFGLAALLLLMFVAMFNDISRIFG